MDKPINKAQMKRLQTLYGQLARHVDLGADRAARIAWAQELVQRPIDSFSDLSFDEAKSLIDTLQAQLGENEPPRPRRRPGRDAARRMGIDGRKGTSEFATQLQLVSAADLQVITQFYTRLGWDRVRFDAYLHSDHSPLEHRSSPEIRTARDANRVRWALKAMLVRAGLWDKRRAS